MPTYEYRCEKGHEFEAFQRMSDPPLTECPECGAAAERRISAGTGLVFKGSGFYITDYKRADEKKKKKAEASGETSDSGSGGAGGKGDSSGSGADSSSSGGDAGSSGSGSGTSE
ncbi:MAG: FmdB family zinc ribbon protein [Gemmatimonadota bacterium]